MSTPDFRSLGARLRKLWDSRKKYSTDAVVFLKKTYNSRKEYWTTLTDFLRKIYGSRREYWAAAVRFFKKFYSSRKEYWTAFTGLLKRIYGSRKGYWASLVNFSQKTYQSRRRRSLAMIVFLRKLFNTKKKIAIAALILLAVLLSGRGGKKEEVAKKEHEAPVASAVNLEDNNTAHGSSSVSPGRVDGGGGTTTGGGRVGPSSAPGPRKNPPFQPPKPQPPVDPNAPKDYEIEDAVRDIPYVTDVGKNRSIMTQRRLLEVKSLSDGLQNQVNLLLELVEQERQGLNGDESDLALTFFMGLSYAWLGASLDGVASSLRQYEEKLKELPDEIEWRDGFLEKTNESRKIITYILCKGDCSKLNNMLRDLNSSPLDILDFMEEELVPYVKNYPDTALYLYFQKNLRDYGELIADSEIVSEYRKVTYQSFLNRLKTIGNTYNVEFAVEPSVFDVDEASLWKPSSSRKAGTRQSLKIGKAEYGFVWIPAGEFDMGSSESERGRRRDEVLHHVKLTKGFWMLETEVTQALYQEVMGMNPSHFKGDDLPVETVSWNDAMNFCAKLTTRLSDELSGELKASLPTEAQWEYSCRAGTKTAYWYGDVESAGKMNCYGNIGKTLPVKSYDPNSWGLYDMHGNVREWCLDYYGDYPSETVSDPKGPSSASDHVYRGGGWASLNEWICRSAERRGGSMASRPIDLGFRFLLSCD